MSTHNLLFLYFFVFLYFCIFFVFFCIFVFFPKFSPFASWPSAMINPRTTHISNYPCRTNFHDPRDVRAIEV